MDRLQQYFDFQTENGQRMEVPVDKAAETAGILNRGGVKFHVVQNFSVNGEGKRAPLDGYENARDAFARAGAEVKKLVRIPTEGIRYSMSDGKDYTVKPERDMEFNSIMSEAGLKVVRRQQATQLVPEEDYERVWRDREMDNSTLISGADTWHNAKAFANRAAWDVNQSFVAIPAAVSLLSEGIATGAGGMLGNEDYTAKLPWTDSLLNAWKWMESKKMKYRNLPATGLADIGTAEGIGGKAAAVAGNLLQGTKAVSEMMAPMVALSAAGEPIAGAVKAAIGGMAVRESPRAILGGAAKEFAGGMERAGMLGPTKAAAARESMRQAAAAKAIAADNAAAAGMLKKSMAKFGVTGAEKAGEISNATRAAVGRDFSKQMAVKRVKDGLIGAIKEMQKPSFFEAAMVADSAVGTYDFAKQNGVDEARAQLESMEDGAMSALFFKLMGGGSAFSKSVMGGSASNAYQLAQGLFGGRQGTFLRAAIAGAAMDVGFGAAGMASMTYSHGKRLQSLAETQIRRNLMANGLSAEETDDAIPLYLQSQGLDDDALMQSVLTSAVFGGAMKGVAVASALRNSWAAEKQAGMTAEQTRSFFSENGKIQPHPDALPGPKGDSSSMFRPMPPAPGTEPGAGTVIARNARGDMAFLDGAVWRAKTNDFMMPNGLVVSVDGEPVSVAPVPEPPAQPAPTTGPAVGSTGQPAPQPAQTTEFSEAPTTRGTVTQPIGPSEARTATTDSAVRAYQLMQTADLRVVYVPVAQLEVNKSIKQFKEGADPVTGVVHGQELQGEYHAFPVHPIIVFQRTDGTMEVASGRHRLDLARRSGVQEIAANVLREEDGWTPETAEVLDAVDNISDQKGTDQDYIRVFRESGISEDLAMRSGMLNRPKGRQAWTVARDASEDLYSHVMSKSKRITAAHAAAIASEASVAKYGSTGEDVQRSCIKALQNSEMTPEEIGSFARQRMHMANTGKQTLGQQMSLFGDDDSAMLLDITMAQYVGIQTRTLDAQIQRLTQASRKEDALRLKDDFAKSLGIKNKDDKAEIEAAKKRLEEERNSWKSWYLDKAKVDAAYKYAADIMGFDPKVTTDAEGVVRVQDKPPAEVAVETSSAEAAQAEEANPEPVDDGTEDMFAMDDPAGPTVNPRMRGGQMQWDAAGCKTVRLESGPKQGSLYIRGGGDMDINQVLPAVKAFIGAAKGVSLIYDGAVASFALRHPELQQALNAAGARPDPDMPGFDPELSELTGESDALNNETGLDAPKGGRRPMQQMPSIIRIPIPGTGDPKKNIPPKYRRVREVELDVYPMQGEVNELPPEKQARVAFHASDAIWIIYKKTGKIPTIGHNPYSLGNSLGTYYPGSERIRISGATVGLVDRSDMVKLHKDMKKKGYFRNEEPQWAASVSEDMLKHEQRRSEAAEFQALDAMVRKIIRNGRPHDQVSSVLFHELWHMADDWSGVLNSNPASNLLGHLAALKGSMAEIIPGWAKNSELVAEARGFLGYYKTGIEGAEMDSYYEKPEEMLAELGSAFLMRPELMQQRAPLCYDAFQKALIANRKFGRRYNAVLNSIIAGTSDSKLVSHMELTWSMVYQDKLESLMERGAKESRRGFGFNVAFWDSLGGVSMELTRAAVKHAKEMRKALRKGQITRQQYYNYLDQYYTDYEVLDSVKRMYTRSGKLAVRRFLAGIVETVAPQLDKIADNKEIAWKLVSRYMALRRIRDELGGRAATMGITAHDADRILRETAKSLGPVRMRAVIAAAKSFRAIYKQYALTPELREMIGGEAFDYFMENEDYASFRSTPTPISVDRFLNGHGDGKTFLNFILSGNLMSTSRGTGPSPEGVVGKRLKGSWNFIEDPLTATAETAVRMHHLALRNHSILRMGQILSRGIYKNSGIRVIPGTKPIRVAGYESIPFMKGGKHFMLVGPKVIIDGFQGLVDKSLTPWMKVSRFLNQAAASNNWRGVIRFATRDYKSLPYNLPGLWHSPLVYAADMLGLGTVVNPAAMALRFVPPKVIDTLEKIPGMGMILNRHTVEHWMPYGAEAYRILREEGFVKAQEDVKRLRSEGRDEEADRKQFSLDIINAVVDNEVLQSFNAYATGNEKGNFERLLSKSRVKSLLGKKRNDSIVKRSTQNLWNAARWLIWDKPGELTERFSQETKLAGTSFLVDQAIRRAPPMPDGTPITSFSQLPEGVQAEVLNRAAAAAGEPEHSKAGTGMKHISTHISPYANARQKGNVRPYIYAGRDLYLGGRFRDRRKIGSGAKKAGEFLVKMLLGGMSAIATTVMYSGLVSDHLLRKQREESGNPNLSMDEAMRNDWRLRVSEFWRRGARNVGRWRLLHSDFIPVYVDDDAGLTVAVGNVRGDEEMLARMGAVGTLNWYLDEHPEAKKQITTMAPGSNIRDAIAEFALSTLFNPSDVSFVYQAMQIGSPYAFGKNPVNNFTGRKLLTDDQMEVLWDLEPGGLAWTEVMPVLAERALSYLPVGNVVGLNPTGTDDMPQRIRNFKATMSRIPLLGAHVFVETRGQQQWIQALADTERPWVARGVLEGRRHAEEDFKKNPNGTWNLRWDEKQAEQHPAYQHGYMTGYGKVAEEMNDTIGQRKRRIYRSLRGMKDVRVMNEALDFLDGKLPSEKK